MVMEVFVKPAIGAFIVWCGFVLFNHLGAAWYRRGERLKRINNLRAFREKQQYRGPDRIVDQNDV
jgi:hypothetical protein